MKDRLVILTNVALPEDLHLIQLLYVFCSLLSCSAAGVGPFKFFASFWNKYFTIFQKGYFTLKTIFSINIYDPKKHTFVDFFHMLRFHFLHPKRTRLGLLGCGGFGAVELVEHTASGNMTLGLLELMSWMLVYVVWCYLLGGLCSYFMWYLGFFCVLPKFLLKFLFEVLFGVEFLEGLGMVLGQTLGWIWEVGILNHQFLASQNDAGPAEELRELESESYIDLHDLVGWKRALHKATVLCQPQKVISIL